MMGVRKLLDHVFEKHELKILDDILPEFKRHEKLDDEEALEIGVSQIFLDTRRYNDMLKTCIFRTEDSYIRIFQSPLLMNCRLMNTVT